MDNYGNIQFSKFRDKMYKCLKTTHADLEMHTVLENNLKDYNSILQTNIKEAQRCTTIHNSTYMLMIYRKQ